MKDLKSLKLRCCKSALNYSINLWTSLQQNQGKVDVGIVGSDSGFTVGDLRLLFLNPLNPFPEFPCVSGLRAWKHAAFPSLPRCTVLFLISHDRHILRITIRLRATVFFLSVALVQTSAVISRKSFHSRSPQPIDAQFVGGFLAPSLRRRFDTHLKPQRNCSSRSSPPLVGSCHRCATRPTVFHEAFVQRRRSFRVFSTVQPGLH